MSGTIAADTPRQARDLLRERGLSRSRFHRLPHPPLGGKASLIHDTARQPAPQSRTYQPSSAICPRCSPSALPLLEALETLAAQHRGSFTLQSFCCANASPPGVSLAEAMREQPRMFDDLCVSDHEVGEDAGTLDISLERLAEFRERSGRITNRLGTALIYPLIVSIVAFARQLFLMTFVVPKISDR